ncbi:hypothetical protein OROGR_011384 [Orobanche gracilis]
MRAAHYDLEHAFTDVCCCRNLSEYVLFRRCGHHFPKFRPRENSLSNYMASTSQQKPPSHHITDSDTDCSAQITRAQKRNVKKRDAYALMDIRKKLSLLDSKKVKYRLQVANTSRELTSTSSHTTRHPKKSLRRTCLTEHGLLRRMEDIPLHAWSLPYADPCPLCKAVLYLREPKGFCCLRGQISLALPRMPQDLWELYTSSECCRAIHFRRRCRIYNNTTAFSSLGITYEETLVKSNKGIYTLRIQGAVYHFIRDLMPTEGRGRQLQLYFYDSENELQNRLSQTC